MNGANPGQQLRDLLQKIYPLGSDAKTSLEQASFVFKIDDALIAEGNFVNLIYASSINYLLRRLINTADYLRRKYESDTFPPEKFLIELRRFIMENTRIPNDYVETVLVLLKLCVEAKKKKLKPPIKKRIFKNAQDNNEMRCYICGKSISNLEEITINRECQDPPKSQNKEEVQVEHIWPRAMGGATEDFNLKLSCSDCNQKKQNYIDASDFHYEQICLVCDQNDESFSKELKNEYKIAIWAKNNYRCSICDKSAASVGRLNFGRLNPDDSWHFLNIEAYCDEHTPE